MWAPWLDAGVDPSLLHAHHSRRTARAGDAAKTTDAGTVRQNGTPAPISTDAAERHVVEAAAWPVEPVAAPHDTDASTLPAAKPTHANRASHLRNRSSKRAPIPSTRPRPQTQTQTRTRTHALSGTRRRSPRTAVRLYAGAVRRSARRQPRCRAWRRGR
jgi:hypothetical protein